jgi:tRNA(Phe) wybutosine-synthesizing methylase Tyw3
MSTSQAKDSHENKATTMRTKKLHKQQPIFSVTPQAATMRTKNWNSTKKLIAIAPISGYVTTNIKSTKHILLTPHSTHNNVS